MENKINIARFKEGSRTAEVKDIWQWDYGQILRIQGLSLPTAVEIHFSLDEHGGEALRRIGMTNDGVTDVVIPDSMLENESAYGDSYYFFAYIYLSDEESGNTEYKIRAKVSTRSKPEGYVSGGNDTFAEILKTVNEIAEDKVDVPASAKVGQVLSVKATDESGKPTEFEATDPGGGVSDEKIAEAVGTYMEAHPIEESDPTVPDWAKNTEKPSYTAEEVGADTSGTAESKVSAHNVSDTAHNDIRLLVQGLTERLNALADSDDTTLDQMSEVVAYIKSNKSLIDAITTNKVSVSDIVDNLTTNVSNKPLSASQGVKLKALIDAIAVPTKLSELENDSGYAKTTDIPDKLPNPQKLTFAGAVTAEYDGSDAVTVTIPEGGEENGTGTGTGLSAEIKSALMAVVENIGLWKDGNGQIYIDNLRTALYNAPLSSISAVYTQSKTVYQTDDLDVLKEDLVVTGMYTDGSSAIVTDYTLSGTLTVGTSMITVSKDGKTAKFEVTVTASRVPATGITLNNTTLSFTGSTPIQLTATVKPLNSTDTVVWSSSENAVATVENGLVTPVADGSCKICATAGDFTAECSVSVALPLSGYNFGNPYLNYVNSDPTTLGKTDEELKGKFYNGTYNSWGNAIGITNQYWLLYPLGEGTHYIRTVSRSSSPFINFYAFSNSDIVANPTTTLGKVGTDYTEATVTAFKSFEWIDYEGNKKSGAVNLGEYSYVDESGQTYADSWVQLRKVVVPKDVYVFMAIATRAVKDWPGTSEAYPYMNDLYTIFESDPSANILQVVE